MNQTFGKAYRLCSKVLIDEIFESGKTEKSYPLVVKYKVCELREDVPFQIVISAPKRTFRSAVKRNRIKRICREAVRKNKHELETFLNNNNIQLGLFLIYSAKEELKSEQLEQKTRNIFNNLIEEINASD